MSSSKTNKDKLQSYTFIARNVFLSCAIIIVICIIHSFFYYELNNPALWCLNIVYVFSLFCAQDLIRGLNSDLRNYTNAND